MANLSYTVTHYETKALEFLRDEITRPHESELVVSEDTLLKINRIYKMSSMLNLQTLQNFSETIKQKLKLKDVQMLCEVHERPRITSLTLVFNQ